jgi:hypothetical protein
MQYDIADTHGPWSYDHDDRTWWAALPGGGFAVVEGDLTDPPGYDPATYADLHI